MRKQAVHKRSLAVQLIKNGHQLLNYEENKKQPGKRVYFFLSTAALQEDIAKAARK